MIVNTNLRAADLTAALADFWQTSAAKLRAIQDTWDPKRGAPVFTVQGRYTSQGWTEWTQGFQFGSHLLQYEATGETTFLESGRKATHECMASHITHMGVHDHGFNNISTYGNLWRLMAVGRLAKNS